MFCLFISQFVIPSLITPGWFNVLFIYFPVCHSLFNYTRFVLMFCLFISQFVIPSLITPGLAKG